PVRRHDLLRAQPVLDRHHRRGRQRPLEARSEGLEIGALAREDRELGVRRQRRRIRSRVEPRGEVAAPRDAQAPLAQRAGVLLPPGEHGDIGYLCEVRREKGADRARPCYDNRRHASTATAPVSRWITGTTCSANSSCALIAFQCSTPPGFVVIAISVSPSQTSIVSRIRWITSSGVPTQTMSPAIISSYGVAASFSMIPEA